MREHEYNPPDENNKQWCQHCGSLKHDRILTTCLDRATPGGKLMPEPARRVYASESWDSIGTRLAEIRKERDTANAANAETKFIPVANEMDSSCC